MPPFAKVLVANRGEIAVRIFRTLRELGIGTVGVYSEADRGSLHAALADEAYLLGPGAPAESYLNQERIVETARRAGAEAGPSRLRLPRRERRLRARVRRGGARVDRPPAGGDRAHGVKVGGARAHEGGGGADRAGDDRAVESADDVVRLGDEYGWPVAIKASAGGGGKGLKVVESAAEAERAFASAKREG